MTEAAVVFGMPIHRFGEILILAALGVAVGDWVAVWRGARRAEYVLKPLVTALLLAAAIVLAYHRPKDVAIPVIVAVGLSLVGDVFLMLPRDLFLAGLASFLLAHVAYVVAFNPTAPPLGVTLAAAAGVALVGGLLYARLRRGMIEKGERAYQIPVAIYVLAIGAMVVSAIATLGRPYPPLECGSLGGIACTFPRGDHWRPAGSAIAIAGALLFMLSDSIIGWTRFVRDFRHSRALVMATYHVAQACLIVALLQP